MTQSLSHILIHIVFSTKKRIPYLRDPIRSEMYLYLATILKSNGCMVYEIGGTENHVHILCKFASDHLLGDIINKLKSGSTSWMKKAKKINDFCWQRGYGVFSVSQSQIAVIANYIKNQMQHHKKISFENELQLMTNKCGIKYCGENLLD